MSGNLSKPSQLKTPNKQFQYEIQQHQEECVDNLITIFEKIHQNQPFDNVISQHQNSQKYKFPIKIDSKNIDIMMETGTGKTFAYIKTIFELHKKFGYKKFIVLIPTVPIREGAKSNFEDTREYFKTIYANENQKQIETFVYENGKIAAIRQFINSSSLSVLIMTPSSFDKDKNVLNRPLERDIYSPDLFVDNQEPPKSYLDCLKRLHPIVIMDEPHRFDGDAFKKYFEGFNNFYLRFGATFPKKKDSLPLSNVAYTLDSISSFRQNLVKKIVVYTQDIVENADTLIFIENKKAIVQTLANGIIIKREVGIGGIFNDKSIKKINKDSILLSDDSLEKIDYTLTDQSLQEMIRQTIQIHLQKEKDLFEKGIKALTLFFMEANKSLYRGSNPKICNIFEEEYEKQRSEILKNLDQNSDYLKYLQNDFDENGNLQVHKGYFSGDKGSSDEKVKDGVDEILRDKKKLLSFESPTRFIFSIWALQEGWDNPNVFTICKLSNQGSEISKLQQIGRGLRICVDQNLERKTIKSLNNNQEDFWQINNLDVVVSSKEQGFVEAIQQEILANSFYVGNVFTEQSIKISLKQKNNFDDLTVRQLFKMLENKELIIFKQMVNGLDIFEKSPEFSKLLKQQNLPLDQEKALENLFAIDSTEYIQNAKDRKEKKKVFIKAKHLQEFQNLWNTINKNAFYILDSLTEEDEKNLIKNIKTEIEKMEIEKILLQTTKANLNSQKIEQTDAITKNIINTKSHQSKVDYLEIIHNLSRTREKDKPQLPIAFVVKIFNSLSSDFKAKISHNPKLAQAEIVKIIQKNLVETIKLNVKYDGIDGTVLPNVFKTQHQKTYLNTGSTGKFQKDIDTDFSLKEKWVFEEVIEYDSDFELEIVETDPNIDEIQIFGKLPRLEINTPLGKYNPDFCYAIKSQNGNKVFLIVEAKGYKTSSDIPINEQAKIDFAKEYFKALQNYYKDQNIKIEFKTRIDKQQLSALINN
jgi:type III restriction enzyme